MPKIKLMTPLWNHNPNDEIEVSKDRAEFAIRKGYAVKADTPKKKTKIDPEAENLKNK